MWNLSNLVPLQSRAALLAIAAAVLAVASFAAGWKVQGWRYEAEKAEELKSRAVEQERLTELGRQVVVESQKKDEEIRQLHRRLSNEISKNTSGRECFGAGAVSVWNRAFGSMPADSGRATRTDSAPDSVAGATDEQVLRSGNEVAELLNKCRDRVERIRKWNDSAYGKRVP